MSTLARDPDTGAVINIPDGIDPSAYMKARYGMNNAGQRPNVSGLSTQNPNQTTSLREMSSGRPDTPEERQQGLSEATKLLPTLGSAFGPEGTAIGMLAHQALSPEGPSADSAISDALFNELIPRGITGAAGSLKGLGGKIAKSIVDVKDNPAIKDYIQSKLEPFLGSRIQTIDDAAANAKDLQNFQNSPAAREPMSTPETGPLFTGQSESVPGSQQLPLNLTDVKPPLQRGPGGKFLKRPVEPKPTYDELYAQKQNTIPLENTQTPQTPQSPIPNQLGTQMGKDLTNLAPDAPYVNNLTHEIINEQAMSSVAAMRNFKLAGGDANALAANNLVKKGFNEATGTFNPDKILDELGGENSEIYNEALHNDSLNTIRDLATKIKTLGPQETKNATLKYVGRRLAFDMAASAGGAVVGHPLAGLMAGEGTLYLGGKAMQAIAQNPALGRIAIKALETPASSELSPLFQKTLMYGLRGVPVIYQSAEGKKEPAMVSKDGSQVQGIPTTNP